MMLYNVCVNKFEKIIIATTDTVVGLGGPVCKQVYHEIFELKNRPSNKSLIIMVGSIEQASKIKGWNKKAEFFANKYWPGATTLVLSSNIALRMPSNKKLCSFLLKEGPYYMTSANKSGDKPYSFEKAKKIFYQVKNYHNFCPNGSGNPSKIIDIKTEEVLR